MTGASFLPGVPADHVLGRLAASPGNEVDSGKIASPESSSLLAVNCFGWFIPRPERLPALPGLEHTGTPEIIDVEFCARFPWSGGKHPWLDAMVQTSSTLIGIESKRFEPFRDDKTVDFSEAYDRDVWGNNMKRFERLRDRLKSGDLSFAHLDATQLVKHAFGLVTTAHRRNLSPALFYIFAEPGMRDWRPIGPAAHTRHREEIALFAAEVAGDEVEFRSSSYRDWLATWSCSDTELVVHREALTGTFSP